VSNVDNLSFICLKNVAFRSFCMDLSIESISYILLDLFFNVLVGVHFCKYFYRVKHIGV
jgi:hypothetical protein